MTRVKILNVSKHFGTTEILKNITLEINDSELMVLVGPSGSGKSTLLRSIAGFESISSGEIWINEAPVNALPPSKRGVAMVFQNYALYPHMTAGENMGFGLKNLGTPKEEIKNRVQQVAEILQITSLLNRKPQEMSGGQRQRVAIGRAIIKNPKLFLFDEPLSNLDAALRSQMRIQIAKLHQLFATPIIYVTHDQIEAMTLADRIAVLNAGHLEQVGTPLELYHHPKNLFVAGFIGSPPMNFFPAKVDRRSKNSTPIYLNSQVYLEVAADTTSLSEGEAVTVGVRPERIQMTPVNGKSKNAFMGQVSLVERLGNRFLVYVSTLAEPNPNTVIVESTQENCKPGQDVFLSFSPESIYLFNQRGLSLPLLSDSISSESA